MERAYAGVVQYARIAICEIARLRGADSPGSRSTARVSNPKGFQDGNPGLADSMPPEGEVPTLTDHQWESLRGYGAD